MPPKKKATKKPSLLEKRLHEAAMHIKAGNAHMVSVGLGKLAEQFPKDARVFDLLASANANLGKHLDAVAAARKAVALQPEKVDYRIRFALYLQNAGEFDEALLEYQRALYRSPNNVYILRAIVGLHTDLGDHAKALEALETLETTIKDLGLSPKETYGVALSKARLSPKSIPAQQVIDELEPLAHDESLPKEFRVNALHNLGRLYESIEDYNHAISSWTEGNSVNKPEWDPDVFTDYINKLIRCWEGIEKVPAAPIDASNLVFITGMMRSGTSLTEQMLAQLPDVTPGGELNFVSKAVMPFESVPCPWLARPYPVSRLIYNQRVVNEISRTAYKEYAKIAKQGIITDKQPYNIFYIPLITRIFPGAKIIHCCRDAQDCCLSNFMQTYARSHPQTHDLYWMGRYHSDYQRMMDAWHQLPGVDILDVHYEDTVDDPETQSKRVCEFIGQPWTEQILNFHKSSRTVRTASRDQVRKPIYKSSVKKHDLFAEHLAPLRQGLGIEQAPTD